MNLFPFGFELNCIMVSAFGEVLPFLANPKLLLCGGFEETIKSLFNLLVDLSGSFISKH